ncbi:MAG: hypothetical protein MUC92_04010 [Fimbriimonadaceae bacterium]|jgi:hypothetical protein|nr:hypothetical protein [Fimbriimonadaceae bacterium]
MLLFPSLLTLLLFAGQSPPIEEDPAFKDTPTFTRGTPLFARNNWARLSKQIITKITIDGPLVLASGEQYFFEVETRDFDGWRDSRGVAFLHGSIHIPRITVTFGISEPNDQPIWDERSYDLEPILGSRPDGRFKHGGFLKVFDVTETSILWCKVTMIDTATDRTSLPFAPNPVSFGWLACESIIIDKFGRILKDPSISITMQREIRPH